MNYHIYSRGGLPIRILGGTQFLSVRIHREQHRVEGRTVQRSAVQSQGVQLASDVSKPFENWPKTGCRPRKSAETRKKTGHTPFKAAENGLNHLVDSSNLLENSSSWGARQLCANDDGPRCAKSSTGATGPAQAELLAAFSS